MWFELDLSLHSQRNQKRIFKPNSSQSSTTESALRISIREQVVTLAAHLCVKLLKIAAMQ